MGTLVWPLLSTVGPRQLNYFAGIAPAIVGVAERASGARGGISGAGQLVDFHVDGAAHQSGLLQPG
jgi:hypothetical protein